MPPKKCPVKKRRQYALCARLADRPSLVLTSTNLGTLIYASPHTLTQLIMSRFFSLKLIGGQWVIFCNLKIIKNFKKQMLFLTVLRSFRKKMINLVKIWNSGQNMLLWSKILIFDKHFY